MSAPQSDRAPNRARNRLLPLLALTGALLAAAAVQADPPKPAKPQTHVTQVLGQATYKQMDLAQKAFDAKDYKGAEAALDVIKAKYDKLNDYEKATLWNLYAVVFRAQDDTKRAIEAYENVLRQNNVPDQLRDSTLFAMAQTFFVADDYKSAIKVMNKWFTVVQDVQPDAYILLAQAYYQLQDYANAKPPILKALGIAKQRNQPLKENWLGLLRAVLFELQDYAGATKVMEVLVTQYPKDTYFLQLSGLYGLQGDQQRQMEIMEAAYLGGYVTKPADILNLARLCLAQEAPQRGVDILIAKFKDHTLELNAENLQLLAQALAIAKDTAQSIPVLVRLSSMTGLSKHYVYLGQAYIQTGDWLKAADALTQALHGKDLANPGSVQMQLGTALYNAGKLQQAKEAFDQASASASEHDAAANWVKFINTEIQRNAALKAKA
jgi:tetratricopeptide (TPR) repeat protein